MKIQELVQVVVDELNDTKGQDLKVLDLRKLVSFTDYFIIVTGTSDRHVQAMADKVNLKLKKEHQLLPITFEGYDQGQWVLLDYGDFVLHIFQPETREHYSLDDFWGNAPQLSLPERKDKELLVSQ